MQSGDSPDIPLVETHQASLDFKTRVKVVEKMDTIPQYTFAGDYTVEAIGKASQEVSKFDAGTLSCSQDIGDHLIYIL